MWPLLAACSAPPPVHDFHDVPLSLDREHVVDGSPLTAATQSVNRHHSSLRSLTHADLSLGDRLDVTLHAAGGQRLHLKGIDPLFLTPLLPYPHRTTTDAFDRANLFLAEFARSGVSLAHHSHNDRLGFFQASEGWLEEGEEYLLVDGHVSPNPRLRPRRVSLTNNCLQTGLWEITASDSVGEMYHAWLDVPQGVATQMLRQANRLVDSDRTLLDALAYRADLGDVPLDLDRLRWAGPQLQHGDTVASQTKRIGAYSTQDSRRKVQRGFFRVVRENPLDEIPTYLADLNQGDRFELHAFVAPGVYVPDPPEVVPIEPGWTRYTLREAIPKTLYPGQIPTRDDRGYVELTLHNDARGLAIVVGNLPVHLLVTQEDLSVPAFGVGVHRPSEPVERRTLRYAEGPRPSFAYLFDPARQVVLNNHEHGYEQIFLRPQNRSGAVWLEVTLVAYERIVDLVQLEIPLEGPLASRIRAASAAYVPPLFRVYRDDNLL